MNFINYLTSKGLVPAENAKFYQIWVEAFSRHLGKDITGYSSCSFLSLWYQHFFILKISIFQNSGPPSG